MGAIKQGISKAFDVVTLAKVMTVGLLALATGIVGTTEGEFVFSGDCAAEWCANDRDNTHIKAETHALINEQVAALGCDTRKRLTDTVAIRKSEKAALNEMKQGRFLGDVAVVRVVPFDTAWELAKQGDAWVVGYCG